MKNQTISVIIYASNEEKNIKGCIESAKLLTNNIIVVDIESKDKTTALAKKLGVEVFNFPFTSYVEPAREFGIRKANTDWVLILDADERITPELASEIKFVIRNSQFANYKISRKNIFAKIKWLRHGGWWPDYQIRLINKRFFKSWPKEIHSTPVVSGGFGYLKNPMVHYFHGDFESMVNKTIIFEDIESDLLFKAKKNVNVVTFFRKFLGELYRRLVVGVGFFDGEIGIIESIYQAFSKTITYIFLYEKRKNLPAGRQGGTLRSIP